MAETICEVLSIYLASAPATGDRKHFPLHMGRGTVAPAELEIVGPQVQALFEAFKLLFPKFNLLLQLSLFNDECRFHLHKVLVILELLLRQVSGDHAEHQLLPAVHVLLQLLSICQLACQLLLLLYQHQLGKERTN